MKRCALCPNVADIYWDPPKLVALTPEGVVLVKQVEEFVSEKSRAFMCETCYREYANDLGTAAQSEQLRRRARPS